MTIPEIENRHKNHHVSFWIDEEKCKSGEGDSKRPIMENEIARKELEKGNNGVVGSEAAKKPCLCSPTNHVGSFRCRLHRKNKSPQKWDFAISCTNYNNNNNKPRLSRFGKAACEQVLLPIASTRSGQVN